ncbi:uncharacterized protein LOC135203303 [Macrobrachium nipponense]|uniref:uncharacterized protein LOC135203303 n=1 Tax=Macrobrachium nipponense TaxID=159736 RepID=UPI0030C7F7BA
MSISTCGSSNAVLRYLAFVLVVVLRHTQTEGMDATNVFCPDAKDCALQLRLQKLEEFFKGSLPENPNATSYIGLGDVGRFFARKIDRFYDHRNAHELTKQLVLQPSREGRQYYAAGTDYGTTSYGISYPGYNYGTAADSSTTFNGLDAALSALAFLAFGVWLFNLVLPQLQVAGLGGVPGLGRRTGQADTLVREGKGGSTDPSVMSKLFTSNQELINRISLEANQSSSGSFVRMKENVFSSAFTKTFGNLATKYGEALWRAFQDIWKPGEQQIPREEEDKTPRKRSLSPKSKKPLWASHRRWKPKTELKGRGLLEDLLGQVWKPFSFIAKLISRHHTDHQFPNSRTETVNGNVDRLDGDLHNLVDNSLSDLWNGKMNSLDAEDPLVRNSLEHKKRHRHGTDLV